MNNITEKIISQKSLKSEIREKLDEIHSMMNEISHSKLTIMDIEYDLSEWITLTDYSKKYNLSISRVQQWIIRGIVPSDCVIVVPELNYLKLLKNKMYYTKTNKKLNLGN
ncbi:hypothetical protein [Dyadobacter frigoris]|uniref:Helix-turn-helix domain-containing protein n=1 Tax=Dyadobacter frigoris TaxID=2576211 RepID=A0A4U6D185_9BACT|nr:hypothetical protein [Dyadobacter frigoris]TKT90969.1 hypothetical protein FDK13_18595 [Dyadobacter frigoris]GLU56158.1 hypothetical protein Dfri01_56190 [Dyadobacter frigoris]